MTITRRARKRYQMKVARGEAVTVPVETVRDTIRALHALGLNNRMIGRAAGIGYSTPQSIMDYNLRYVEVAVADAIAAVTHLPHPNQKTVLAIGARRRVRALQALGYEIDYLASLLGHRNRGPLNVAIRKDTMTYPLWARIRDLYDELSGTPGPSEYSRAFAHRQGYAPPLAWEGVDIDDPRTQPDWIAAGIQSHERPVCVNNHPRTAENTVQRKRGRECRLCIAAQKARYAARQNKPPNPLETPCRKRSEATSQPA